MSTQLIGILVGLIGLLGVLLIIVALRSFRATDITRRVDEFVVEPERANLSVAQVAVQQTFTESFLDRTFGRSSRRFVDYLGKFTPRQTLENLNRKLTTARNPYNLRAREFYGVRLIIYVLGFVLAVLLNLRNSSYILGVFFPKEGGVAASIARNYNSPEMLFFWLGLGIIFLFFLLPAAWLASRVRVAKESIQRTLPDALDLLSVCSDAGLGFDQAMQRVGETLRNNIGAEFNRVISEMEVGVSRAQALRNMATRVEVLELSAFVAIIIQAETLGMQIAEVLHSQAEQMRIIRQFRAKEIAYRLPAKMIIPLAVCILPALMAVILAPLIPRLITLLSIG